MKQTRPMSNEIAVICGTACALLGAALPSLLAAGVPYEAVLLGLCGASVIGPSLGFFVSDLVRRGRDIRWWHVLWLLLVISGLTWRRRGLSELTSHLLDSAALFRVLGLGVAAIVVFCALLFVREVSVRRLTGGLLFAPFALGVFGVLSTIWSVNPAWTLYRSSEYLVDVLLVGLLVTVCDSRCLRVYVDLTYGLMSVLLASVYLGLLLWPSEAIIASPGVLGFQLQGVMPAISANGVGDLGAVLGAVSLVRLLSEDGRKAAYIGVLIAGAVTMVVAQSRTPILAFCIACFVVLFALKRMTRAVAGVLALIALWTSPARELIASYFRRGQNAELMSTLSGRVDLYWLPALEALSKRWLTGWGAYAGGRFVVIAESSSTVVREIGSGLENAFLETALGLGLVGLLLLALTVAVVWRAAVRLAVASRTAGRPDSLLIEAMAILAIESVRSLFSAGPFIWHPLIRFSLVLGVLEWYRRNPCWIRDVS